MPDWVGKLRVMDCTAGHVDIVSKRLTSTPLKKKVLKKHSWSNLTGHSAEQAALTDIACISRVGLDDLKSLPIQVTV